MHCTGSCNALAWTAQIMRQSLKRCAGGQAQSQTGAGRARSAPQRLVFIISLCRRVSKCICARRCAACSRSAHRQLRAERWGEVGVHTALHDLLKHKRQQLRQQAAAAVQRRRCVHLY